MKSSLEVSTYASPRQGLLLGCIPYYQFVWHSKEPIASNKEKKAGTLEALGLRLLPQQHSQTPADGRQTLHCRYNPYALSTNPTLPTKLRTARIHEFSDKVLDKDDPFTLGNSLISSASAANFPHQNSDSGLFHSNTSNYDLLGLVHHS